MVPVGPDPTPSPELPVDRTRQPNRKPGHSSREGDFVVRFDQEVNVIGLN
jgi:hypothetical protein